MFVKTVVCVVDVLGREVQFSGTGWSLHFVWSESEGVRLPEIVGCD